jgi:hypothetical protein
MQEVTLSTQENAVPFSLAHLLIELSQDTEKREEFRRDPSSFLANHTLSAEQLDAILSRDPHLLRSAFGMYANGVGLDGQPLKKPKKKPAKKKKGSKKK